MDPRTELAPGDSEAPYTYDGKFEAISDCYEDVALHIGEPLTARVCYGTPSASDGYAIEAFECAEVSFEYGTPSVEIALY